MEESKIMRKIKSLQDSVAALAGQMSEANYRIGELEKKRRENEVKIK